MSEEVEDNVENSSLVAFRTKGRNGRALPVVMLTRAIGRQMQRFRQARCICVLLIVKSDSWVDPFVAAAKSIGKWTSVVTYDTNLRNLDRSVAEASEDLAMGGRVLAVFPQGKPVPAGLEVAADLTLTVDRMTKRDLARSIKIITDKWPVGLTEEDVADLDLAPAIAAIRANTTPTSCVRRLRNSKSAVSVDPLVALAPPLEDLHGYGQASEWARRLVDDLGSWRAGDLDFSAIQRNVVLAGPPGTGKSTFARSLAKSCNLPLIVTTVGQMFGQSPGYVDSVIKQIDQVFARARAAGPAAVVLIDELDGFPDRNNLKEREASWWTPVVNHMLTSLDSALSGATSNLIVVGATNHPHRLDPALVRPGRLDRIIHIGLPDETALAGIYRQHLGDDLKGEDLSGIATVAVGSTGAEVAGHVKGARGQARRQGRQVVMSDLVSEIFPMSELSDEVVWRMCIHEAGHAVSAVRLGIAEVISVSVAPTSDGNAGQTVVRHSPRALDNAANRAASVVHYLSGRAAEEVLLEVVSGGSGGRVDSDLARASAFIASSHLSFGLGDFLTYLADPADAVSVMRRSPGLIKVVEAEMREHYAAAMQLMRANADHVYVVAEALKRERVLTGSRVLQLIEDEQGKRMGGSHG